MTNFAALEPGAFYLIREEIDSPVEYVTVLMHTENAVLLRSMLPEQKDFFKSKSEEIHEIIEALDDEMVMRLNGVYEEEAEEELFEFEEDDEDD